MKKSTDGYKIPNGGEMAYFDSTMAKTKYWKECNHSIYDKDNPVAYTLEPLFEKKNGKSDMAYVAYNDQVPENFYGTKGGHSKGILMVGATTAVWLQHSVPRFPKKLHDGRYEYPESGRENAQLFLCVTFPAKETDIIAQHLRVQYANVYQKDASKAMLKKYPIFHELYSGKYVTGKESLANDTLLSMKRQRMRSVAKRGTWHHDIYTDIVAPYIVKDDIYVESWTNGAGGTVDAFCRLKYSVTDVKTVRIMFASHKQIKFSSKEDHSKWAVAAKKSFFCFSSLNRMKSQYHRGGEVTCMENGQLANLFRNSIKDKDSCEDNKQNEIPEYK
ncbi:unnamed protein product [Ixodes hexagonus]